MKMITDTNKSKSKIAGKYDEADGCTRSLQEKDGDGRTAMDAVCHEISKLGIRCSPLGKCHHIRQVRDSSPNGCLLRSKEFSEPNKRSLTGATVLYCMDCLCMFKTNCNDWTEARLMPIAKLMMSKQVTNDRFIAAGYYVTELYPHDKDCTKAHNGRSVADNKYGGPPKIHYADTKVYESFRLDMYRLRTVANGTDRDLKMSQLGSPTMYGDKVWEYDNRRVIQLVSKETDALWDSEEGKRRQIKSTVRMTARIIYEILHQYNLTFEFTKNIGPVNRVYFAGMDTVRWDPHLSFRNPVLVSGCQSTTEDRVVHHPPHYATAVNNDNIGVSENNELSGLFWPGKIVVPMEDEGRYYYVDHPGENGEKRQLVECGKIGYIPGNTVYGDMSVSAEEDEKSHTCFEMDIVSSHHKVAVGCITYSKAGNGGVYHTEETIAVTGKMESEK